MKPVVVTPTYNESANLENLVIRVRQALPDAQVVVVDDASPDGTGRLAEDLDRRMGGIHVIHRAGKLGLGSAYREGFGLALAEGFDPIFQMDADLSHDPADLPRLLAQDADLVLGTRYMKGGGTRNWPLQRKIISRGGTTWARAWLGLPYRDLTGGFKCWRAATLRAIDLPRVRSEGYVFQVETTWRACQAGFRVVEAPIIFTERLAGVSKMNPRIAVEAAWRVPVLRFGA